MYGASRAEATKRDLELIACALADIPSEHRSRTECPYQVESRDRAARLRERLNDQRANGRYGVFSFCQHIRLNFRNHVALTSNNTTGVATRSGSRRPRLLLAQLNWPRTSGNRCPNAESSVCPHTLTSQAYLAPPNSLITISPAPDAYSCEREHDEAKLERSPLLPDD